MQSFRGLSYFSLGPWILLSPLLILFLYIREENMQTRMGKRGDSPALKVVAFTSIYFSQVRNQPTVMNYFKEAWEIQCSYVPKEKRETASLMGHLPYLVIRPPC
jgi:hypothetical protein